MIPDHEFVAAGHRFRATRLSALEQGKVLKRILPLIPPLIPLYQALPSGDTQEKPTVDVAKLMQLVGPFTEALSSLKDEDLDWLIQLSVSSVQIEQDGRYTAFWNRSARRSMFADLEDISVFLPVTVNVVMWNLAPFFSGILTGGIPGTPTTVP